MYIRCLRPVDIIKLLEAYDYTREGVYKAGCISGGDYKH